MQRGKYKCKQLKAVRKRIAEENGIPLEQRECTYEGPCRGTCPHCESEVRYLERALADRIRLGKVATVAGLSLGLAACGGQNGNGGTAPMLTTDSSLVSGPLVDSLPDTLSPGTERRGPESMEIEEMGEIELSGICISDDTCPLPPPPTLPEDGDLWVGEVLDVTIPDEDIEGEVSIFTVVESDPEFPGGMDALYKYLEDNIKYPQKAKDNDISGKVYVTFVVEKDGSITNPRLLRDIGGGCGQEALRVVKAMPRWNPGKQRGKPVRVQFNLPVSFNLK